MPLLRTYGFFLLAAVLIGLSLTVTTGAWSAWALVPQLAAALAVCVGLVLRDTLTGTLATAFVGFLAAGYLLRQKVATATGPSLCNIDSVFNCDVVNASAWSMAFGIPISLLGMAFYGGLIVAGLQSPTGARRNATFDRINAAFALVSSVYSLFLLAISKQIGAFCVVCITMYLANFILLWAGWRGMKERGTSLLEDLWPTATSREALSLVATFLVASVWGSNWYQSASVTPEAALAEALRADRPGQPTASAASAQLALGQLYSKPGGPIEIGGHEPLLGNADARFLIAEFADFGCPHCADAGFALKELVAANPDVAVRFKYFPLSGACNPMLADPSDPDPDPSRCHAALAAECAHQQGKFWEMSHLLFTNQRAFAPEQLEGHAEALALDMGRWRSCMADPKTASIIERSAREGEVARVTGTPAIYIRGLLDDFILVRRGVPAALALIEAHRDGIALPAPPPG